MVVGKGSKASLVPLFAERRRDQLGLEQLELLFGHRIGVLRLGKTTRADIGDVGLERDEDGAANIGVLLHESRQMAGREAQQVVPDEYLAVARRPGPDANRWDGQLSRDARGDGGWNGFEHDSKT